MKTLFTRQLVAAAAFAALSFGAQSAIVYSLAGNGTSLVRFDSSTPGVVTVVGAISGSASSLSGLDFRPADGFLYGFQQSSSGIFRVNTSTGVTTLVSTSTASTTGAQTGIDFNPVPDRMRVVSTGDNNLRINVATGTAIVDGTLAYAAADVNSAANPNIVDAAYTNSDTNPATGTSLFYIDSTLDTLVTTTAPNGGVLSTVGALGFDTSLFTGFDIFTDPNGINTAFASLTLQGNNSGLYTINLNNGAATFIGAINANSLFGLAVAPAVIPEPGTLALFALAGLAAFGITRRRNAGGARKTSATQA